MANQMIALQARNPQLPDPSRQTAQYVNMMNMASQQRAAQLQGERTRQEMEFARAGEARAVETQTAAQKKAGLEYLKELTLFYRDRLARINPADKARYGALREKIVTDIPAFENELPLPDEWNKDTKFLTISKADDVIKYSASTPVASLEVSEDGIPMSTVVGGLPGVAEQRPVYDAQDLPTAAPAASPAVPTAGAGVAMRATGGANTTPQDLIRQGMNPDNVPSGMPTSRPISFNQSDMGGAGAAQMTPELMSNIVDSAFQTGVMAQVDFDQILASQPPQNKQALMDSFQRANITLQADAPSLVDSAMGQQPFAANPVQTPEASFARLPNSNVGARNASPFETTLAQTQPRTITRIQQKTPNVSPAPAETPQQAGNRARAERITPAETAANEAAKIGAQTKANIAEENRLKAKGRKLFSSVLNDLRNDYRKLNEMEAIPSVERGGFENVGDYIGASRMGRMAQSAVGAKASVPLNTISNSKLTLMNALKEATGLSATQLSSNIELMTFLDSLADPTQGFESAMETIRRLENLYGAPAATATAAAAPRAAAKTPVIPDAARQMLRKNPSPQQRAFFDRTFGKGAAAKVLGVR